MPCIQGDVEGYARGGCASVRRPTARSHNLLLCIFRVTGESQGESYVTNVLVQYFEQS